MFDDEWLRAAELVVRTWKLEQNHDPDVPPTTVDSLTSCHLFFSKCSADVRARQTSPYKYHSEMAKRGVGADAAYTGMTWSGSFSCVVVHVVCGRACRVR
jgi:meiotically up-regulated gene 157 (Mug157) protein